MACFSACARLLDLIDLGSIMIEENVVSSAGATFRMTVADMKRLITELGYEPHQRDNWYRLVN